MQKWEYLVFALHLGREEGYSINGKVVKHDYGLNEDGNLSVLAFKQQKMNELGNQGWELVTDIKGTDFVFKRPIP